MIHRKKKHPHLNQMVVTRPAVSDVNLKLSNIVFNCHYTRFLVACQGPLEYRNFT